MMACNTMHLYYKDIFKDDIGVENLSLIKETVKQVKLD
jgi:aspartate/glutamate racemase